MVVLHRSSCLPLHKSTVNPAASTSCVLHGNTPPGLIVNMLVVFRCILSSASVSSCGGRHFTDVSITENTGTLPVLMMHRKEQLQAFIHAKVFTSVQNTSELNKRGFSVFSDEAV